MKSSLLGLNLFVELMNFLVLSLRSRSSLAAENSLPAQQLCFYRELGIKPGRILFNALDPVVARSPVRLATRIDGRDAQKVYRLAL